LNCKKSSIINIGMINNIDETNGLYPFMIAGSQSNYDLEMVYFILALSSVDGYIGHIIIHFMNFYTHI
jgi:hypothetical protein